MRLELTRLPRFMACSILLASCLAGCASLNSVSMTAVPKDRGQPISAKATNWAFLGIHFTNDFVDEAIDELRAQCPHGRITGIYTKYEGYFYLLLTRRVVQTSGYCETAGNTKI